MEYFIVVPTGMRLAISLKNGSFCKPDYISQAVRELPVIRASPTADPLRHPKAAGNRWQRSDLE